MFTEDGMRISEWIAAGFIMLAALVVYGLWVWAWVALLTGGF